MMKSASRKTGDMSNLPWMLALLFMPLAANASAVTTFVGNVTRAIIEPVIYFLFALALYYFVSGLIPFVLKSDDPKARSVGRGHLIWGILGFFIMTSAVAILAVVTVTFCNGHVFCRGV